MKYYLYLLSLVLIINFSHTMEQNHTIHTIALPGQNGLGCKSYIKNHIINSPYSKYKTLESGIDLGQENCIKHFEKQFNQDKTIKKNSEYFLTGVSQGTATMVNWFAYLPKEQQDNVKGMFLESVLLNGNSAILHTVENLVCKGAAYLPYSRSLIPWIAKAFFPAYNPLGKQMSKSATNLPNNLPIIIMHAIKDPQLSINDARKLYNLLRNNGNNNVYLFEINQYAHIDILEYDFEKEKKIKALQKIYQKHNLPYNNKLAQNSIDLKEFQPSTQEVEKRIKESTYYSGIVRNSIDLTTAGVIAFLLKSFVGI